MNKNISINKLLGAGIIIGIVVMLVWIIFSGIHKVEKKSSQPEIIKEEEPNAEPSYTIPKNITEEEAVAKFGHTEEVTAKPGHATPQSIFPTDDEAKENLKSQLERQQIIDKALAEKMQIMTDVRKDVEASLNGQPASTVGEPNVANGTQSTTKQVTTTFSDEQKKLALQKDRVASANRGLFVHH